MRIQDLATARNGKKNDINGECKPYAIGKEIVWKNDVKESEKKASFEPTKYAHEVNFDDKGFVLRQDQKSLTYKNSEDNISGRYLYDQEDVTDDY